MRQHEISPAPGSRKGKKRVGRGNASGHGTYCGRGVKGQKSRSGFKVRPGFQGGELPLIKSLPRKRGFFNRFRIEYSVVNIGELGNFASGSEVTPQALLDAGLLKTLAYPVKILAEGELKNPLVVKASKFSNGAKTKIEAAGGKVEEI